MKLLEGGASLDSLLAQLINDHDNIAFAVAWASAGTRAYDALVKGKKKIKYGVVGTHFYQTHPDVLQTFVASEVVHFVLQPTGVFHPKVYLFWTKKDWELLIGSANLTGGALGKNSELMVHISSEDASPELKTQLLAQIKKYWSDGCSVTKEKADAYAVLWKVHHPRLLRISGEYPNGDGSSPLGTPVMAMSWTKFVKQVTSEVNHQFEERRVLLELVREAWAGHAHYSDMDLPLRQAIAGLPNALTEYWGWFGSMSGAGKFRQAVNNNNQHLSNALDFIPRTGEVGQGHYNDFVAEFVRAFPDGRDGIGVASRLLSMKRPDYFVCLNAKNRSKLCTAFGIKQSGMTYERYWEDVIDRITDSVWWNQAKPADSTERLIWSARAAMLDAFFFEP